MIKSRAALTYAEAQTRIDDQRLTDDVSAGLRELNRIAKILRQRRAERGALSLASPEVRFEIDTETHDPTDVGMYQVRSSTGSSAAGHEHYSCQCNSTRVWAWHSGLRCCVTCNMTTDPVSEPGRFAL